MTLFDSSRSRELKTAVTAADLLIIGGGPLMDLREMQMLAYAMRLAKRRKVRSLVFSCGIGPLTQPDSLRAAAHVLRDAESIIMRDSLAADEARRLSGRDDIQSAVDPAAYCALRYRALSDAPQRIAGLS